MEIRAIAMRLALFSIRLDSPIRRLSFEQSVVVRVEERTLRTMAGQTFDKLYLLIDASFSLNVLL